LTFPETNSFETFKGIKLGMGLNDVIKIFGTDCIKNIENDEIILNYGINGFRESKFLQFFNLPQYYGTYKFKKNMLIEFKFGFIYP